MTAPNATAHLSIVEVGVSADLHEAILGVFWQRGETMLAVVSTSALAAAMPSQRAG